MCAAAVKPAAHGLQQGCQCTLLVALQLHWHLLLCSTSAAKSLPVLLVSRVTALPDAAAVREACLCKGCR